jgi:uncharacterized protein YbjQ (UPF0145 family)
MDWYSRFFGGAKRLPGGEFFDDIFKGFDQMRQQMDKEFEDIQKKNPKTAVKRIQYTARWKGKRGRANSL